MEELFADLWQVPRFTRRHGGFRPQIDCYRTEQPAAFHVVVELAGVDPAKIQVFADERHADRLPASAAGRAAPAASTSRWRSTTAASSRQIALGADVDVESSKATYQRGILTIVLPLAKKPASVERIEIPVSIRSRR